MKRYPHLYIDGEWVEPVEPREAELIDPFREEVFARVSLGGPADVDRAVAAAQRAFETFSATSVDERIALIDRVIDVYESYTDDFSELIAREVGIPVSNRAQVTGPADHMRVARDILRDYPFESHIGSAIVRREPIGVCALISPWNWPIQTGVIKIVYALAAGCTIVAKPSMNSAASGALFAQVLHEADVPPGVFNLVNGAGRAVGDALSRHPGVDMISPWNWPIQTGVIKIVYALAAGCTIVAKPSMNSAASGALFAQVLHEADVPAGVFNLVNGAGRAVGDALSRHPGVDMISFTGSTGAGRQVGAAAADTIKRVCLELGGKSANIVLPDADLEKAARWNIQRGFFNAGQSCHAPTRMLVHESQMEQVVPFLVDEASRFRLGDPLESSTTMGPVVSAAQFKSIRDLIQSGLDEGARLVTGGLGQPEGLNHGYFVQPTVFADVTPEMTIAREEVFGPVLAVMPYRDENDALRMANDSPYGLGGFVFGGQEAAARRVVNGLRTGRVSYNGAATDSYSPMGGYKQSGIGRSMGRFGLEEYLEVKSVYGFEDEAQALPPLFG